MLQIKIGGLSNFIATTNLDGVGVDRNLYTAANNCKLSQANENSWEMLERS